MRKRKAFLVAGFVFLLLALGAWQCGGTPSSPTPCPPTPTPCDTSTLESQLAACQTAQTMIAEDARATIGALETALATCSPTQPPHDCAGAISCAEALANEGEVKKVQGKVVDSKFASGSPGQPTFLNLCYPYGDARRFTALIWGEDRQEFIDCLDGPPEEVLLNREVCVEGLIEIYEGIPQIILTKCGELTVLQ